VALPAELTATPYLAISSVIAGAFTPGIAALSAARMTELMPAALQIRAWGFATLVFGLFQAVGAYGMAFAYGRLHSYAPLYLGGAGFEAVGALLAGGALYRAPGSRRRG
jgi:hypothetical protein